MAHITTDEKQTKVFIKIPPYPLWLLILIFSLLEVSISPPLYCKYTSPLLTLSVVWNTYQKPLWSPHKEPLGKISSWLKPPFQISTSFKRWAWFWTQMVGLAENWQIWVTRWGKGVMKTFVIQTEMSQTAPWIKPKKHLDIEAGFSKIASTVSLNSWDNHERANLDASTHQAREQTTITE